MMVKTTPIPHVFYPIQGKAPMATETEKKLTIKFTDGSELAINVENVSIIKYTDGMLKAEITRNADNPPLSKPALDEYPENNGYDEDDDFDNWDCTFDPDGDYEDAEERAEAEYGYVETFRARYND